jgi:hypothetical protein
MDIYEEELWQYEKDLKAWNLAQSADPPLPVTQAVNTGATS